MRLSIGLQCACMGSGHTDQAIALTVEMPYTDSRGTETGTCSGVPLCIQLVIHGRDRCGRGTERAMLAVMSMTNVPLKD